MTDEAPKRRRTTLQEVTELRLATVRLTDQVSTLSHTLQVVGQLQEQQRQLSDRVMQVAEDSATVEDIEQVAAVQAASALDFRTGVLRRIHTTVILMALAAIMGLGFYVQHVETAKRQRYDACLRVEQVAAQVHDFTQSQIDIERSNRFIDNPLRMKRVASLERLANAYPTQKCEKP